MSKWPRSAVVCLCLISVLIAVERLPALKPDQDSATPMNTARSVAAEDFQAPCVSHRKGTTVRYPLIMFVLISRNACALEPWANTGVPASGIGDPNLA